MEDLKARLLAHGIDLSRFGQGKAKSLEHLLAELRSGEAELVSRDGRLVRRLQVLNIDVYADGRRLRLIEDRQVFTDGRVRRRDLPCSVAEKLKAGEDREAAVARALAEELHIHRFDIVSPFGETLLEGESPSFPGLWTAYATHQVAVLIDPDEYRTEYQEAQPDKSTFFVWVVHTA